MRFTVTWHPDALAELARIWVNAIERSAVTSAANQIDKLLCHDAGTKGTKFHDRRMLGVVPLAVTFDVNTADRLVTVLQVWRDSESN